MYVSVLGYESTGGLGYLSEEMLCSKWRTSSRYRTVNASVSCSLSPNPLAQSASLGVSGAPRGLAMFVFPWSPTPKSAL
jgi:hypothetical protein